MDAIEDQVTATGSVQRTEGSGTRSVLAQIEQAEAGIGALLSLIDAHYGRDGLAGQQMRFVAVATQRAIQAAAAVLAD
jgi:hypothetical protein